MTLTDRFQRRHGYLRISVTDRCNMRCRYCMPHEDMQWQPKDNLLTYEEITRLAKIFITQGVHKIRLTGGEPTIRKNLDTLIAQLAAIPGLETLAMTTNGASLRQDAARYKNAGLQSVTVSLDSLKRERFKEITRRDQLADVLAGIDTALQTFNSVKLNMVVMGGINDDEIFDFVSLAKDRPLNVRLIEYMPFRENGWSSGKLVPYADMRQQLDAHYALIPVAGHPSNVAKDFRIEGFTGSVSFVTSMTESFCGTCNRLRLTADGAIKPCLFDNTEVHLRDAMRNGASDAMLAELMQRALTLKPQGHAPAEEIDVQKNRPMIAIGG